MLLVGAKKINKQGIKQTQGLKSPAHVVVNLKNDLLHNQQFFSNDSIAAFNANGINTRG